MRFELLSHNPALARNTRAAGKFSALALGMALGFEGVIAGPLHAAPTVGGDDNGPQVRILQPNYQDVLKGKTGILIAVQSAKFNPDSVSILVDDKVVLPPTHLTEFPSAHFDWDTKIFADGQHKLTVLVTDTQGFRGWAEVIVYINNQKIVDTTPPSLSWLNIKPMQQISGTAQIQLQAVDNFGVKWIIVAVNPASAPNRKPPMRSWLISHPPYTINFDTNAVPDGKYSLSAKAWDAREQEGSAPTLNIGVANSAINLTSGAESLDTKSYLAGPNALSAPATPTAKSNGNPIISGWTDLTTGKSTDVVVPGAGADGASAGTDRAVATPAYAPVPVPAPVYVPVPAPAADPALVAAPAPDVAPAVKNLTAPSRDVLPGHNIDVTTPATGSAHGLAPSSPDFAPRPVPRNAPVTSPARVAPPVVKIAATRPTVPLSVAAGATSPVSMHPPTSPAQPANSSGQGPTVQGTTVRSTRHVDEVPGMHIAALPSVEVPLAPPTLSARAQLELNGAPTPAQVSRPTLNGSRVAALLASPQGDPRETSAAYSAALSAPNSAQDVQPAAQGAPVSVTVDRRRASLVAAPPMVTEREVQSWDQALLTGPTSAHTAIADGARLAALPRDAQADFAIPDHTSVPDAEGRVFLGSPVLSSGSHEVGTRIAEAGAVKLRLGADYAANLAPSVDQISSRPIPNLVARAQGIITNLGRPLFSALSRPVSLVTASQPVATRVGSVSVPSRTAQPDAVVENQVEKPRFSRLPSDAGRPSAQAYSGGITVSPLAVSTANTHPAFHLVERTTNLRAVASLLVGPTSVPGFRFLWEKEGGTLDWDAANRRVIARNGEREVVLSVGSKTAKVDNKDVMMDLAAFLMSGRTMVPVRLFEEGLHAHVEWEPETGRMYVAMAN